MKWMKLGLRLWIGISTLIGFLLGWILLAHSGSPAAASVKTAGSAVRISAVQPALQPVPSLDDLAGGAQVQSVQPLQPLPASPRITGNAPRLRTSGS